MDNFWFEFIVILLLILANGFFAGSEIAILSMRRSRTKELIKQDSLPAKLVGQLQENFDRFLATVQIGVTVIGTLASAFGGASAIQYLKPALEKIPLEFVQHHSQNLALAVTVIVISYLSLVLGELVPKSLALRFSEKIALGVAFPIHLLSKISYPFIKLLTFSNNLLLFFLPKQYRNTKAQLTESELRIMLSEGVETGAIEKEEHQLIENIFEFTDLTAADVMVPTSDILALSIDTDIHQVIKAVLSTGHSKIPVFQENLDNIVGVLYTKDLLRLLESKEPFSLKDVIRQTHFVPETKRIIELMREFQENRMHMAVVINEYGGTEGIITMEDILDEITGEITKDEERESEDFKVLSDGSILLKGSMAVKKFNRKFETELPESEEYKTMAGFLSQITGHIPELNETIQYGNLSFVIVKKFRHRIQQIKVRIS